MSTLRSFIHKPTAPVRSTTDLAVANEKAKVVLILRPRNPLPALADLPSTPLDHDELEARYGAREEDIAKVEAFAKANGLREEIHRDRAMITLSGTLAAIDRAFNAGLHYSPSSRRSPLLFAPEAPPSIPDALLGAVEHVLGLDNRPVVVPSVAVTKGDLHYHATQVAALYNYPKLTGKGQCVGIMELAGGYDIHDLEMYFKGLPPSPRPVPLIVNEGPNEPLPDDPIVNMEVTMDLQIIGSLCPEAKIVVYNAGSKTFSLADYFELFARAIFDQKNKPSVLSNSWGWPLIEGIGPSPEMLRAFEDLFCKAALLGVTICSSSGDSGSFFAATTVEHGMHAGLYPASTFPVTQYPASSAFVLGCGGTTLLADTDKNVIASEVVWNRLAEGLIIPGIPFPGTGLASGGGVARQIGLPYYQTFAGVPPATSSTWDKGVLKIGEPFHGRGVPDVAANADLYTGYNFVYEKTIVTGGGTSAAAPMWAGLVTLINQALGKRVGFLNPTLYELQLTKSAKVFRPIVTGGNGGYFASADRPWNPCTGLGSPDASKLLRALQEMNEPVVQSRREPVSVGSYAAG